VDFNPADDFPTDDIGYGFDNIGDVLSLPPVLMERYFVAAEGIANQAILPVLPPPPKRHMDARYLEPAGRDVPEGKYRPISTKPDDNAVFTGPLHYEYKVPDDGEYIFRSKLYAESAEGQPVRIAILAHGPELAQGATDDEANQLFGKAVPALRPFVILHTHEVQSRDKDKPDSIEVKVPPNLDLKRMAIALYKTPEDQPPVTLHVDYFHLEGPLDTRPKTHRAILACDTSQPKEAQTREVLTRLMTRAFRRPAQPDEVERFAKRVEADMASGLNWEGGIQRALIAVLVSPKFLFRVELDDRPESPEPRPLDEFQLASRLSYFLWSTMPDEQLFALAAKGELTANLDAQVKRMLADKRAESLVQNFAMQWLELQRLRSVAPDSKMFPNFDDRLRRSMQRETELFLTEIIREDRSIYDLVDADFTYLNETLARHYGIADTNGNFIGQPPHREKGSPISRREFVRVSLGPEQRGGLLTQASILTVTSNPTRTSPVKRGRWVLEQILGDPPPPPPPDVPLLEEDDKSVLTGSLRQRMEQHRTKTACANCHARMDPIGFVLENYDAIGRYRTKDGEFPIETAGVLPDGKQFGGLPEFKQILRERKDQISRCFLEKLVTFGLGRGLEYYDRPVIDRMQTAVVQDNGKFSTVIREIVRSEPFRFRRGLETAP
ncbi:MAG TPA: DUF1592 domain-containing protein, partial [Planctomycetaceae bacterium]|nr:DUF1592 domain-containing protein [Planctomycetaceae bacterium]